MDTESFYEQVTAPVRARQWTPDTDPEDLASWCGGWLYTGNQHGHTDPPWQDHTCLNLETTCDCPDLSHVCPGKGHADPGDWLVCIRPGEVPYPGDDPDDPGTYMVLGPDEFAARYRTRLYGLTAGEWLHLASEGQDSEVAPCCGDIGNLREWLCGLTTAQGEGESHMFHKVVLDAYEAALSSHDGLDDAGAFPLLHRVITGVRKELDDWNRQIAAARKDRERS